MSGRESDKLNRFYHSLFSNPRIRVDIKSEATQEDASQSVVALNRVSTLLKEVKKTMILLLRAPS
jgi:hypothetical protein